MRTVTVEMTHSYLVGLCVLGARRHLLLWQPGGVRHCLQRGAFILRLAYCLKHINMAYRLKHQHGLVSETHQHGLVSKTHQHGLVFDINTA